MIRTALCESRVFEQQILVNRVMVYSRYLKNTLCHRAGFVKYDILRFCERLEIIRAFNQNTLATRTADTGEEAKRYTYH